jgi:murein DD-endopeptidase MepM/ murein hydrolase activator NlpD
MKQNPVRSTLPKSSRQSIRSRWLGVFATAPFFVIAGLLGWMALRSPTDVEVGVLPAPRGNLLVSPERVTALPLPETTLPTLGRLSSRYDDLVDPAAEKHGVPADLVRAVISVESNGNPRAVSRTGARGLMQLMPQTARQLKVQNAFNAEQNIEGGVKYLKQLSDQFDGDLVKTVAAYNAGPGAVKRHGGRVPPFAETRNYVKRVLGLYSASGKGKPGALRPTEDGSSVLVWPCPGTVLRRLKGSGRASPTGIEVRVAPGATVRAASEARVISVETDKQGLKQVTLRHDARFSSTYARLAVVLVVPGQLVTAGDLLGSAATEPRRPTSGLIRFDLKESGRSKDPLTFRWRGVTTATSAEPANTERPTDLAAGGPL